MKSNIKVLIARTTLFFACGCLLFLGIVAFAPPSGGDAITLHCGIPRSSGEVSFKILGKWIDTKGHVHDLDHDYHMNIDNMVDEGNGHSHQKTAPEKAEEIKNNVEGDIPKVDHDGDPSTPDVPLFAVSWSGGQSNVVEFKLTDNNPTQTHDLRFHLFHDLTKEHFSFNSGAAAGYAFLAEFVGDITGQDCEDPSQPSRVSIGINGTVAEITLDGEWTREALAQEMVEKLVNLGFRASVVRDTIIHVQTPSDTPATLSFDNTDRGLGVEIDITD